MVFYSPVNAQRIIKDANAAIGLGMIELITLVLEHRSLTEYSEAVSEALWDKELPMIILGEFYSHMLPIGGTTLADVHCHIKYSTFYAAYKLALCKGGR